VIVLKGLATLLLASYSLALLQALVQRPPRISDASPLLPLALAFALGVVLFGALTPFMRLYVFGHELTHYLVAKAFGRKTGRFRVGAAHGFVEVANPNIWITLSPYMLPIYTVLWVIAALVGRLWWDSPRFGVVLFVGVGLTYAYHVVLTIQTLRNNQPDLQAYGPVFSLALIVAINFSAVFWGLAMFGAGWFTAGHDVLRAWEAQARMLGWLASIPQG